MQLHPSLLHQFPHRTILGWLTVRYKRGLLYLQVIRLPYSAFVIRPSVIHDKTTSLNESWCNWCKTTLADWMRDRDFLADWPGRRDKALKPGLSRLKRDVWYRDDQIVDFHYPILTCFVKMIFVSDPNPVLVEIILSVSENYPKVYCGAQYIFCTVPILPC